MGTGLDNFHGFHASQAQKTNAGTGVLDSLTMLRGNLSKFFNIVLIFSCVIHVIFILYTNSNPSIPEIILHNKNIMDVNMPLSFIFCLRNTNIELEKKKYKEAGYDTVIKFYSGTSMFNDSVVGWLGHMENGSTYNSLEGR